jgi:hypothetical protein
LHFYEEDLILLITYFNYIYLQLKFFDKLDAAVDCKPECVERSDCVMLTETLPKSTEYRTIYHNYTTQEKTIASRKTCLNRILIIRNTIITKSPD